MKGWAGLAVACAVVIGLAAGCGGGSSSPGELSSPQQPLHLDGFNVTPDNYRGYLRVLLLAQGASSFCNGLKGLSAAEFLALPTASSRETPMATPPANWTPVPGQTKNPDDALAAAQILIDECDRVSP